MKIAQSHAFDMASLDAASGLCTLTIADHLAWDDRHLFDLQIRINDCLQCIESGDIYLSYPAARGCDFAIDMRFIYAPDAPARAFLEQAERVLDDTGYRFSYGPLGSRYADDGAEEAVSPP